MWSAPDFAENQGCKCSSIMSVNSLSAVLDSSPASPLDSSPPSSSLALDAMPRNTAAIVSHELRALTRRATELAEVRMIDDGWGPPPQPYAMLVLGSGGRGESLLAMDQDNAIVYADGEPGSEAAKTPEKQRSDP